MKPILLLSGLFVLLFTASLSNGQLTKADFEKLHAQLLPDQTEPWRQIPWKTSVLEAQNVAASEGKPLFIWAMDGHPLGCT